MIFQNIFIIVYTIIIIINAYFNNAYIYFFSIKALLSSLRTVETTAPAAGTAKTEASIQAERAAGASTPSRLSLGLSLDITQAHYHKYQVVKRTTVTAKRSASRAVSNTNAHSTCHRTMNTLDGQPAGSRLGDSSKH